MLTFQTVRSIRPTDAVLLALLVLAPCAEAWSQTRQTTRTTAADPVTTTVAPLQEDEATTSGLAPVTVADAEAVVAAAEALTIPEAEKIRAVELAREALASARAGEEWRTKARGFAERTAAQPTRVEALKAELARDDQTTAPDIPTTVTAAQLEQRVAAADAEQTTLRRRAEEARSRLDERAVRRADLPRLASEARQRLEELRGEAAAPPTDENAAIASARTAASRARVTAAEAELESHEAELAWMENSADLLELEVEAANRRLARAETATRGLREALNERRRDEAAAAVAAARQTRAEVATSHPLVATIAEKNEQLAHRRTGPEGLGAQIETAQGALEKVNEQRVWLRGQEELLRKRLAATGRTDAIGQMLLRLRRDLPEVRTARAEARAREEVIARARNELITFEEQRAQLGAEETRVRSAVTAPDDTDSTEVQAVVHELFTAQRRLLDSLIADTNSWFATLVDLDTNQRLLLRETEAFSGELEELILWTRSARPLGAADVPAVVEGLGWLAAPANWAGVAAALSADAVGHPQLYIPVLVLVPALYFHRRRLKVRLVDDGRAVAETGDGSFGGVLRAMGLTLAISALFPAVVWFVGWRLQLDGAQATFVTSLGRGLQYAALALLAFTFSRRLCVQHGVADAYFHWGRRATRALHTNLAWFTPVILSITVVVMMLSRHEESALRYSLGRLVFAVGMLAFALLMNRLLHPATGVFSRWYERNPGRLAERMRVVLWMGGIISGVVVAVAALLGWYYASIRAGRALHDTLLLVLGLSVVYGLLRFGLVTVRRNMAMREARRRAEEALAAATAGEDTVAGAQPPGAGDKTQALSVYELSGRVEQLMRIGFVVVLAVGLWGIWSNLLPAFNVLNRVELWSYTARVAEVVTAADGTIRTQAVERVLAVTPTTILGVMVLLGLTFLLARNIPALVEFAVADRFALDAGVRFAYTALARYTVLIIGAVVAFRQLGISWSSVQWLAAAVTVGLGFGLQEIFGNFVSGLILLFERPVRVGDTVTVGSTTGTVTQIRIRSTTILDWDGKVLIVPNKQLITGEVTNWTLNDTTTRVSVVVGVAFGNDPDVVRQLLMDTAQAHPLVLKQPPPFALFNGFNESTLNFTLFAFTGKLSDRGAAIHELHTGVARAFREAGISIAFPQRDLHIVSSGEPLRVVVEKAPAPEA